MRSKSENRESEKAESNTRRAQPFAPAPFLLRFSLSAFRFPLFP
jgi:hypothetical protein